MGDLTMAMSKAEVRRAFRTVMAADHADVPAAEEIRHVFSGRFLAAMEKLIAQEKRGSWHLLSRQRRRLIVAAILAAALLLTACSPKVRQAVTELVVSFYKQGVDYSGQTTYRGEIETVYVLDPAPEGFAPVSQDQNSPYFVATHYEDGSGTELVLKQAACTIISGFMDNEQGEVQIIGEGEGRILICLSEGLTTATWIYDGYHMSLSYFGPMDKEQILVLKTALAPMETGLSGK